MKLFHHALEEGHLPNSMQRDVITLIYDKAKDPLKCGELLPCLVAKKYDKILL